MTELVSGLLIWLVRLLVGARADWRGCAPNAQRRIYFANHSSHFDTLAVMAALPPQVRRLTRPAAAQDYWGASPTRRFIAERCLRAVLIDRAPPAGTDPLAPLQRALEGGCSILIFPEGTRGDGEAIARFRSGIFQLSQRFPDVDLVPVYLDNLQRILPKGSFLIVPITCTARFGAPMRAAPGEERGAFLERARAAVLQLAEPGSAR
jgi:1-acyl-sn-glycerol-3-phosphate acyltransferase